ncbi:VOC family protein [Mycobacterium sp. BMJ-28]
MADARIVRQRGQTAPTNVGGRGPVKVCGLDHIHLLVSDLPKAIAVAEALIGGKSSDPYGGQEWNAWASYHQLGGFDMFQPIDMDKPIFGGVSEELGVYIVAFRVDDIDEAVANVTDLGLPIVSRIGSEEAGFGKQMLQAQLERYFGAQMELVERGLPDDPLHCPIPKYLDHIEFYVHDIAAAMDFFTMLTGASFPPPAGGHHPDAVSTTNGLGIRLTQPTALDGPISQIMATHGEGVHSVGVVTADLDRAITDVTALGLTVHNRRETPDGPTVVIDPVDFLSISLKIVERV